MQDLPTIKIYKKEDFRAWLKKNGERERRMAVIVHKKHTGKSAPTHRELLEEAICFGWIDTTVKRLDADTFLRNFAHRTENSRWSDNTLRYAKELIKKGRMTPVGIHFYKLGLKKPTHDHGIPKNPDMPAELEKALSKNLPAENNFHAFSPSVKRAYYRWILRAKRPETRLKRVGQIIKASQLNNKKFLNPAA